MKKNRRKRKTVFSVFTHKRQVVLKYQLKGELRNIHMKSMKTSVSESLWNEVAGLKACNSIQKRLQHRCFFL